MSMLRRPHGASVLLVVAAALACAPRRDVASAAPEPVGTTTSGTAAEPPKSGPQVSDDPIVSRIVELGRSESLVHEHLRHLAKVIGPRLTGSHQLMVAERWA